MSFFLKMIIIWSFILILPQQTINSQEKNLRPKVGLALSGGGAKGIAHIGVIRVMEEAGLRPDFITGVSMGSIVGGLYAAGYSADSLIKIVRSIDWNLILSDNIPENKVIFLEKHYFDNNILSLPVTKYKIKFPTGLIKGQQIESTLSTYAWPVADINDFSKLPIPYMCIGTDINTCKKVDIKSGYLADAMRASMAVPSVFTPIKIDSTLFVDGGMVRNIAVSEIREMGADIVIGSYTGEKLLKENELNSIAAIMGQIGFYAGYYDAQEQMKLVDILIKPDIKGFSMASFKDADTIIDRGYRAALPYKAYFKKLADSLNRIGPQDDFKNILTKKVYSFDKIEINGNEINTDDQIKGILGINPGDKVDNDFLREKIELLYGKVWFDKVKYSINKRNDSLILVIDCYEKPRILLTSSFHYDNFINTGLIMGFSGKNLLSQRSKINVDAYIGQYYRVSLKYLQFIDRNEKYGISADIYTEKNSLPGLFISGKMNEAVSFNSFYTVTLQGRVNLNQMFSLSAGIEKYDLKPNRLIDASVKRISSNFRSYSFDYSVNTLDTKHFPNRGNVTFFSASTSLPISVISNSGTATTRYTSSDKGEYSFRRFYTLQAGSKHYISFGKKWTLGLSADGLVITDTLSTQYDSYFLGGPEVIGKRSVAMIGFEANEMAVKKFAGLGAEIDLEIFKNIHINMIANTFLAQMAGTGNKFSFYSGYGIGMGYLSIIGPVKAGIMYSGNHYNNIDSRIKGYVSIGYSF
jgi:NTE family protein